MTSLKYLYCLSFCFLILSCGSNSDQTPNFSISINTESNKIILGETLNLTLTNKNNLEVTNTIFKIDDQIIQNNTPLSEVKLGKQIITASITYDGKTEDISKDIVILNSSQPTIYTFDIINEYQHDITSYTQGLEFYNGQLYESTGQYGKSKLRLVDYKTGDVLKNKDLANSFFGEGLSILNDNIYQLTWRENTGFVYDVNSFEKTSSFKYGKSKEGWGLCNDNANLYKSDGTENIWTLDSETLTESDFIQVYTHKGKIPSLNELEWINGKIYANIYQRNGIVIINPNTGAVEGVIDFSSLKDKVTQHPELDVLNGIAYNPETETIFVTGKHWDKLFEVTIKKQ